MSSRCDVLALRNHIIPQMKTYVLYCCNVDRASFSAF